MTARENRARDLQAMLDAGLVVLTRRRAREDMDLLFELALDACEEDGERVA